MALEVQTRFFVRCDHCVATLRTTPYHKDDTATALQFFTSPLAAIHRALEAHWSVRATSIFCPTCSNNLDAHHKEA